MANHSEKRGMSAGVLILLAVLVALVSVVGTGYFYYKEKYAGSSVAYSHSLIKNLDENSFEYKMAKMFYSADELAAIRSDSSADLDASTTTVYNDNLDANGIEIQKVHGTTYEAYMMIVHNPQDVYFVANPNMDSGATAPNLEDYITSNGAIAGTNAGGFQDDGGTGNGGVAWGIVIHDGKLIHGSLSDYTSVVGINSENKLIVGNMSAQTALDYGIRDAVTFGPILLNNYSVVYKSGDGGQAQLNPRTAIGQRADGTFLLLVIDGRGPTSFGAKYEDIIGIMQYYDAQTAACLDGGNSSAMMYNNEYVNDTVSMYGSRHLPTAVIVKGGN
jgi:exopolysaccharide biosynthesis protein